MGLKGHKNIFINSYQGKVQTLGIAPTIDSNLAKEYYHTLRSDTSHYDIWCNTRRGNFGRASVGGEKWSIPSRKKLQIKP